MKKNLILSNSHIALRKNLTLEAFYEFNFDVRDFKIKNQTSINSNLKIKYLIYNDVLKKDKICTRCHKIPKHRHVGLQTLKILSVWEDGGYAEIRFETPEEKEFQNCIIKAMRKNFYHGKNVCSLPSCDIDAEFNSLKKEGEVVEALNDVKEMHRAESRNQVRF